MHYAYNDRYYVNMLHIVEHQQYKYYFDLTERGGITYIDDSQEKTMIYNPYLATLLNIKALPVFDQIKGIDTLIDGWQFFKYYKKGFRTGLAKFDKDYTPVKNFIKELHRKYYGDGSGWAGDYCMSNNNWAFTDLSTSQFEKLGYWAGLTFRIKEVMKDYPVAFEELDELILTSLPIYDSVKEPLSEPEKPMKPKDDSTIVVKLSHAQIATLYHIIGQTITDNNAGEIAQRYGQTSGQRLHEYYKNFSSGLTRTGEGKNRIKDYEKLEPLISDAYKELYKKELGDTIKNNKRKKEKKLN